MSDFEGIFPYLVSPVNHDGTVKEKVMKDLINHLIESGVHGITVLGSTGEFAYLNWEQKKEIVRVAVEAAGGWVPVIAGVSHASSVEAASQAKEFEKMGVDGILAILDTYFPLKEDQIVEYFKTIAESVNLPIVIYNNPKFSRTDLSVSVIDKLARIPNIEYLKDASGNTGKLLTVMTRVGNKLKLFSASASIPLSVMMFGGVGWMAGPACVIPRQAVKLYNLAKAKKWDEAIKLQRRLWRINEVFQKYGLAPCIKAALEIQGFPVGDPIPPLKPLDEAQRKEIADILEYLESE